jgi:predicted nucleic acid-binding protein
MCVVLDTNILVSALIAPAGNPSAIYNVWEQGRFTLLTCTEHLDELRARLQRPRVANLINPYKAGRLVNQIKKLAEDVCHLPRVKRSPDPWRRLLAGLGGGGQRRLSCDRQERLAGVRQSQVHADHNRARLRRLVCRRRRTMIAANYGENSGDLAHAEPHTFALHPHNQFS